MDQQPGAEPDQVIDDPRPCLRRSRARIGGLHAAGGDLLDAQRRGDVGTLEAQRCEARDGQADELRGRGGGRRLVGAGCAASMVGTEPPWPLMISSRRSPWRRNASSVSSTTAVSVGVDSATAPRTDWKKSSPP